jgi:coenzyme F420-reducing hydrogenase gamma subunit
MNKPKVAVFDFACCEGCQLQLYNLEEEIIDLLSVIEPVQWREAMSDKAAEADQFDIAIIEGSITRQEDEEQIKLIRNRSKILIALGACATIGGVNKLKNQFDFNELRESVYGEKGMSAHLETATAKAVSEVVPVDVNIHGCPIELSEFKAILRSLLAGKKPFIPGYPVCVECKKKGIICRYEYSEICLGPVTRAGCGARCPSGSFWCFGCRGPADNPNVDAAKEVMTTYGKTPADLAGRLMLFNFTQEKSNG